MTQEILQTITEKLKVTKKKSVQNPTFFSSSTLALADRLILKCLSAAGVAAKAEVGCSKQTDSKWSPFGCLSTTRQSDYTVSFQNLTSFCFPPFRKNLYYLNL